MKSSFPGTTELTGEHWIAKMPKNQIHQFKKTVVYTSEVVDRD